MNLSKNTSLGLVIAGGVLVLLAIIEHFALAGRAELIPHLAIILVVLAIIVAGVGAWGMMSGRAE